jgi:hypothetical protein
MKIPIEMLQKMLPPNGRITLLKCPDCSRAVLDVTWTRDTQGTMIAIIRPGKPKIVGDALVSDGNEGDTIVFRMIL